MELIEPTLISFIRDSFEKEIGDYGSLSKNMQFPHDFFFVPYLYRKNVIPFRSFDFWTEDIMYREYIFRKQAP